MPSTRPGSTLGGAGGEGDSLPGRLLYVGDSDVWLWERGAVRRLTGDRISRQPVWSPDGKWIAHVKIDVSSSDVWVMDETSANGRALTRNYSTERARNNWAWRPIWWPDASRVLYLSDETTHELMLWQVTLDGRTRRPFLTVPDREGGLDRPTLAPDARRLAAVTYRAPGARPQIWTWTFPNGPWRQVTDAPEGAYDPAWSPDGARLAYTIRAAGRHDVWVADAEGGDPLPVTTSGAARAPCWSPDGRWLAFISGEHGDFDAWVAAVPLPTPAAPGAAGATPVVERILPPVPRRLTRGAALDAVSGLSWTGP